MRENGTEKTRVRFFQAGVLILLTLIAIPLWGERMNLLPQAAAQIPDAGMQKQQMVDELRISNDLLARILRHLETRPIKVEGLTADEAAGSASEPRGPSRSPISRHKP